MAVVAITGGPGAPGATSAALALLLSWPLTEHRRVLLVEADPDGGAVLAGALAGEVQADKGLRNLAVSDRRGRLLQEMWDQCIDLSPQGTGDRLLLPGLTDPAQAAALVYTWEPLAEACRTLDGYGCDVIVDLGRSGAHGPSAVLARRADAVLAVLRTTLRGLSTARPRIASLAAELARDGVGDALALLLIREGPYTAAEISRVLGAPVVGLLPFAPKEARILSDGGGRTSDRRFQRSELMRAARSTGDELRALTARRRLVARPAAGAPQQAADLPAVPAPAPDGVAADVHAVIAPGPAPLRAVPAPAPNTNPIPNPPAPPAPAPAPFTAVADATRLGYRHAQVQEPNPPVVERAAQPSPWHPDGLSRPEPSEPWDPVPRPWSADTAQWAATGRAQVPQPRPIGEVQPPAAAGAAARLWPQGEAQPPMVAAPNPGVPSWPGRTAPDSTPPGGLPVPDAGTRRWSHTPLSAERTAHAYPGPGSEAGAPAVADAADAAAPTGDWHIRAPERAWPTGEAQPPVPAAPTSVPPATAPPAAPPWSVREMLDLAAAAELGARTPAGNGPAQSPLGPVTPGQAARLQSVHLEPARTAQPLADGPGNPFNPADMVAMPPLAEHAPRPPAPGEFRPAEDGGHGDGNGAAGEVARVR